MLARTAQTWVKSTSATATRAMSSATDFNWTALGAKLHSNAARTQLKFQQAAFEARVTAANRAFDPPEIDWESYREVLSDYDLDAIKADFDQFMADLPDIQYDESADLAEHTQAEDKARAMQNLSIARSDELAYAEEDADDFKLHDFSGAHEMYLRHPGLYERLNEEVLNREAYHELDAIEKTTELSAEAEEAIEVELLKKGGLTYEDVEPATV